MRRKKRRRGSRAAWAVGGMPAAAAVLVLCLPCPAGNGGQQQRARVVRLRVVVPGCRPWENLSRWMGLCGAAGASVTCLCAV